MSVRTGVNRAGRGAALAGTLLGTPSGIPAAPSRALRPGRETPGSTEGLPRAPVLLFSCEVHLRVPPACRTEMNNQTEPLDPQSLAVNPLRKCPPGGQLLGSGCAKCRTEKGKMRRSASSSAVLSPCSAGPGFTGSGWWGCGRSPVLQLRGKVLF